MRTCFIHLAEAFAYRRDPEVPLRAVMVMLKAGERCNAEPELIGKGINGGFLLLAPFIVMLIKIYIFKLDIYL